MKSVVFQTASGSPDTAEWHAWRAAGIGGSDAPVIGNHIGLCSKPSWMKSLHHLWLLKTMQIQAEDLSKNPAIRRGKEGEEPARVAYEVKTGNIVQPVFGEMDAHRFIRSSFDGMSFARDLLVEIKCPSKRVHELALFGKIVDYYQPQVIHQALTAWGPPEGWTTQQIDFASYQPEIDDLAIVSVPAKKFRANAEKLLQAEIDFWIQVEQLTPPCGEEWMRAAERYVAIKNQMLALEEQEGGVKDELITLLGAAASMEGGGVSVRRSSRQGSIDYPKILKDLLPGKDDDEIAVYTDSFRGSATESIAVRLTSTGKKKSSAK